MAGAPGTRIGRALPHLMIGRPPLFAVAILAGGLAAALAVAPLDGRHEDEERERPTMIRSIKREDRPASGTMLIDAGTGRVLETDLRVQTERHWTTDTQVTYGRDARLEIWVPTVMRERHRSDEDQYIEGTATYSNFRRFETSARIVPR